MSKKVLLFSRDPGGANTVIPLFSKLSKKGYQADLYGKDAALARYNKFGLQGSNILDFVPQISLDSLLTFLKDHKPDFVITGTSADDFTEKYLWSAAERLGIPSFAILDQWINYGIRFSAYSVSQSAQYNIDKQHVFMPSKVLVMDQFAKDEMTKEGLDSQKILVSGQPYFDLLGAQGEKISEEDIAFARQKVNAGLSDLIITYASEVISDTYLEKDDSNHYWGYTEHTILREILMALETALQGNEQKVTVVIRQHPKEKADNYADFLTREMDSKISLHIDRELDGWTLIKASDIICGMSSMFLIESMALHKPTLSIQIGLKRENPFVFDRTGILKSILDRQTLIETFIRLLQKDTGETTEIMIQRGAVDKIIRYMEEYICQSLP